MKTEVFTIINDGACRFSFRKSLKQVDREVLNNKLKNILATKLDARLLMTVKNTLTYYGSTSMTTEQIVSFYDFLHGVNNIDKSLMWDSMIKNK